MIIFPLEEEMVFVDYIDQQNEEEGFKLVESAPDEAVEALESYKKRAAAIRAAII